MDKADMHNWVLQGIDPDDQVQFCCYACGLKMIVHRPDAWKRSIESIYPFMKADDNPRFLELEAVGSTLECPVRVIASVMQS